MTGNLTIRLQRAGVIVELQGDAEAVRAAFADMQTNGLGALVPYFDLPDTTTGAASSPSAGQGSTPLLTKSAASYKFLLDSMILPTIQHPFSADINGDGRLDNQFANIISALTSQSLNLQAMVDAEMKSAPPIMLLTVATELSTLRPDQRAVVTLFAGTPVKASSRVYIVDASVPAVTLQGRITAGRFASDDPRTGGLLVEREIRLPLGGGIDPILSVQGLRLAFDISADGSAISNGQLTGSVKQSDVLSRLIPALAGTMTRIIQAAPKSSAAKTISQLFDKGGCTNPGGTVAQANDGVIDVCELLTNPLIMSLIQPDVQIWDAQGHFAPNSLGGSPDSMSIGIGFSAITATY